MLIQLLLRRRLGEIFVRGMACRPKKAALTKGALIDYSTTTFHLHSIRKKKRVVRDKWCSVGGINGEEVTDFDFFISTYFVRYKNLKL